MTFLCLGYLDMDRFDQASESEKASTLARCDEYCEEFRASGVVRSEIGVDHYSLARVIRPEGQGVAVSNGCLIANALQIGSCFIIDAPDMDAAVAIAGRHPAARLGAEYGFCIEIRPAHSTRPMLDHSAPPDPISKSQAIGFVAACVGMACLLGLCLDMVTAHVCVEYFTVHHPKIMESQEPIHMALYWGIAASWWFGLIAGCILLFVNRRLRPPVPHREIIRSVAMACATLWLTMMAILGLSYMLLHVARSRAGAAGSEFDIRLAAVSITHLCEYLLGAVAMWIVARNMKRQSLRLRS